MTDEFLERISRAVCDSEPGNRAMPVLAVLRPGDRLPGGLIVAREEPTEAMLAAGAWKGQSLRVIYKTMLAAQLVQLIERVRGD